MPLYTVQVVYLDRIVVSARDPDDAAQIAEELLTGTATDYPWSGEFNAGVVGTVGGPCFCGGTSTT